MIVKHKSLWLFVDLTIGCFVTSEGLNNGLK